MARPSTSGDAVFQGVTSRIAGGFKTAVFSVRWSCDGEHLFAVGDSSSVRVFETLNLARRDQTAATDSKVFSSSPAVLTHVAPSPADRHLFAAAGHDGALHLFDTRRAPKAACVVGLGDRKATGVAWSGDGGCVVVSDAAAVVRVIGKVKEKWEVRRRVEDFRESEAVCDMRWSRDGGLLYVARGDGRVEVRTWPAFQHVLFLDGHRDRCVALTVDPTGRRVAVAGGDALVTVWDARSMTCEYVVDRLDGTCACVDFCAGGKYLALARGDGGVEILNAENAAKVITIPTAGPVRAMKWHPTKLLLAYCVQPTEGGLPPPPSQRHSGRMQPGAPMVPVPPQAKAYVYGFASTNSAQRNSGGRR